LHYQIITAQELLEGITKEEGHTHDKEGGHIGVDDVSEGIVRTAFERSWLVEVESKDNSWSHF